MKTLNFRPLSRPRLLFYAQSEKMSIVDSILFWYNLKQTNRVHRNMIRTFVLTDLERILEIERHSFPKSPYSKMTFIHLYWLYPKTFWVYAGQPKDQEKEEVYGYLIFSEDGHLISLAVHPKHRRRGIGERLIKKAVESLAVKKLWAEVRQSNQGALAFYRKIGFQIVGTVSNYYGNEDALIVQFLQG